MKWKFTKACDILVITLTFH